MSALCSNIPLNCSNKISPHLPQQKSQTAPEEQSDFPFNFVFHEVLDKFQFPLYSDREQCADRLLTE